MNDFRPFSYISLFTGGGGLDLGFERVVQGARCIAHVEVEAFCRAVLVARTEEGLLAPAPVYSDVRAFNGRRFYGLVDAVIGGSPCQDMSFSGKRAGLTGEKSILFYEQTRILDECGARWCLWENVLGSKKYLPAIFEEFARIGFAGKGVVLRASDVGAPHQRARIFVLARRVADADQQRRSEWRGNVSGSPEASEPENRRLSLADAQSDGRLERRTEPDAQQQTGFGGAGPFDGVADTAGQGLSRPVGALVRGEQSRLTGAGDLADASGESVGVESGWSRWSGRSVAPVAGLAGEDVADAWGPGREVAVQHRGSSRPTDDVREAGRPGVANNNNSRCEVEWGIRIGNESPRYDADGRGGAELADASFEGSQERGGDGGALRPTPRRDPWEASERVHRPEWPPGPNGDWSNIPTHLFPAQPRVRRVADELARGVEFAVEQVWADRLRMLGNAVVPKQVEEAIRFLYPIVKAFTDRLAALSTPRSF